jgi:hypothetical protein
MSAQCKRDYRQSAQVVNSCPDDQELVLFVDDQNVAVFRRWGKIKECLGTSSAFRYAQISTSVSGEDGQPVAGLTTYQDDRLIGCTDLNFIIVNGIVELIGQSFTINTTTGTITRTNQWFSGDLLIIPFNERIV